MLGIYGIYGAIAWNIYWGIYYGIAYDIDCGIDWRKGCIALPEMAPILTGRFYKELASEDDRSDDTDI